MSRPQLGQSTLRGQLFADHWEAGRYNGRPPFRAFMVPKDPEPTLPLIGLGIQAGAYGVFFAICIFHKVQSHQTVMVTQSRAQFLPFQPPQQARRGEARVTLTV